MQNHYNLLYREEEREMIPLCRDQGVGLIPYSPLARGFLAGTGRATATRRTDPHRVRPVQDDLYGRPEDFDVVEAVVADRRRARRPARADRPRLAPRTSRA